MQLIPKIFHRIWLGPATMPSEFRDFGRTWVDHHPGWDLRLWTEQNLPSLINEKYLRLARNYAQQSDVLRYELLYRFGGIYLDTDFCCQKNIEPLLEDLTFFGAGERPAVVSAGIFGATARHPIVMEAIREMPTRLRISGNQAITTGPGLLTALCNRHLDDPALRIYGPEWFYPYPWNEKHRRGESFPDAYAIHHWSSSWHPSRNNKG